MIANRNVGTPRAKLGGLIREVSQAASSCTVIRLPLPKPESVVEQARRRLANNCPYGYYFNQVAFEFNNGTLTLRGRVPTFYLKQVLQTWLREVDGVERIDNQVDVVNATGLSSEATRTSLQ